MGSLLHKQGYIHEVKSAISEFMQYGISTQDMDKLIASAEKKGRTGNETQRFKDSVPGDFRIISETILSPQRRHWMCCADPW